MCCDDTRNHTYFLLTSFFWFLINRHSLRAVEAERFCTDTVSKAIDEAKSFMVFLWHIWAQSWQDPRLGVVRLQHPFCLMDKTGHQNCLPLVLTASSMALILSRTLSFVQGGRQAFHHDLSVCLSHTLHRSAEGSFLASVSWFQPVEDICGAASDLRDWLKSGHQPCWSSALHSSQEDKPGSH